MFSAVQNDFPDTRPNPFRISLIICYAFFFDCDFISPASFRILSISRIGYLQTRLPHHTISRRLRPCLPFVPHTTLLRKIKNFVAFLEGSIPNEQVQTTISKKRLVPPSPARPPDFPPETPTTESPHLFHQDVTCPLVPIVRRLLPLLDRGIVVLVAGVGLESDRCWDRLEIAQLSTHRLDSFAQLSDDVPHYSAPVQSERLEGVGLHPLPDSDRVQLDSRQAELPN